MVCPSCKVDRAHRSHRRGVKERLAALFSYNPYRCHECGHRFLLYRYAEQSTLKPLTATERQIISLRQTIRKKRSRRELLLYTSALMLFVIILYWITREHMPSSDQ